MVGRSYGDVTRKEGFKQVEDTNCEVCTENRQWEGEVREKRGITNLSVKFCILRGISG